MYLNIKKRVSTCCISGLVLLLMLVCSPQAKTMQIETYDLQTKEKTYETITEYPESILSAYPLNIQNNNEFQKQDAGDNSPIRYDPDGVVSNSKRFPYCVVGKLIIKTSTGTKGGTGYLVGRSLVLTAAHCLYFDDLESITFVPGMCANIKPFGTFKAIKSHVPQKYIDEAKLHPNESTAIKRKYDYAAFEINSPIGDTIGYLDIGGYNTVYNQSYMTGKEVTIVGYPHDDPEVMHRNKQPIFSFNSEGYLIYTNHLAQHGQSGSPLIYYKNNKYCSVGILIAGPNEGQDGYIVSRYITKNVYELVNRYKNK